MAEAQPPSTQPSGPNGPPAASGSSAWKWILGCLAAVVLLAGLACAGIFGFGWWAAKKIGEIAVHAENVRGDGEVGRLHAQALKIAPYDAKQALPLTAERVEAWSAVRSELSPALEKNRLMVKRWSARDQKVDDFGQMLDLVKAWSEVKLEHARLLVKHRMSAEEFTHITRQAYGALIQKKVKAPEGLEGVATPDDAAAALLAPHLAGLETDEAVHLLGMLFTADVDSYDPPSSGSSWGD